MYELSAELRGFVVIFNLDKNTPTAFMEEFSVNGKTEYKI